MTLEELKKYREKCVNVQNTIKADIEYIKEDIAESERQKKVDMRSLCLKIAEYLAYLPTEAEMGDNGIISESFYRTDLCYGYVFREGLKIKPREDDSRYVLIGRTGTYGTTIYDEDLYKEVIYDILRHSDRLLNDLGGAVAEVNNKYNNILIQKNKKLLDKAEELKEI